MEERLYDMKADIEKLKALAELFERDAMLDMYALTSIQHEELMKNHDTHAKYFSAIMDYIDKLQEQIDILLMR